MSSATFVSYDTQTLGNWHGVYGADGYFVVNDLQSIPEYASFSVQKQNGDWTWDADPTDPRALRTGSNSGRIASCWCKNHESFTFNIELNDGNPHPIELYALDWDSQVLDATANASLDSRTISNFINGIYLVWNVTSSVIINVNIVGGQILWSAAFSSTKSEPFSGAVMKRALEEVVWVR